MQGRLVRIQLPPQRKVYYLIVFFVILFCPLIVTGQSTNKIEGVVLDAQSGLPVAGASVRVLGQNQVTITNAFGFFAFDNLPNGEYRLLVSSFGFKPATSALIKVNPGFEGATPFQIPLEPIPFPLGGLEVIAPAFDSNTLMEFAINPTVITRQQIEKAGKATLAEVLAEIPGLFVRQTGTISGGHQVSIRGSNPEQVLVLINGQRHNSLTTGEFDFSTIPLTVIERVEVIKGASAAKYGADALAGVINIVTRNFLDPVQTKTQSSLKTTVGDFGTRIFAVTFGRTIHQRLGLSLVFDHTSTRGDFWFFDSLGNRYRRQNSGKNANNYYAQLSYQVFDGSVVTFSGQLYRATHQIPGALLQLTPTAWRLDDRGSAFLRYTQIISQRITLSADGSYQHLNQEFSTGDSIVTVSSFHTYYRTREWQGRIKLRLNLWQNNTVTLGSELVWMQLSGQDFLRPKLSLGKPEPRRTKSLFIEDEQVFNLSKIKIVDLFSLVATGRYDKTSGLATNLNYALGTRLLKGKRFKVNIYADWGRGYHNPTLTALFWKEDVFAIGNPYLKPERSLNREAGVRITIPFFQKFELGSGLYASQVEDLISWRRRFDGKFTPVNIVRATIQGREDFLKWQGPHNWFDLQLQHTFTLAVNHSGFRPHEGKQLVFRPDHILRATLDLHYRVISFQFRYTYVGRRYIREENTKWLLPYRTVDCSLGLSKKLGRHSLQSIIGVNNLTGTRYEVIERQPMPGREWRVQLEISS